MYRDDLHFLTFQGSPSAATGSWGTLIPSVAVFAITPVLPQFPIADEIENDMNLDRAPKLSSWS